MSLEKIYGAVINGDRAQIVELVQQALNANRRTRNVCGTRIAQTPSG